MNTKYVVTETYKLPEKEQSIMIAQCLASLIKAEAVGEVDKQIA